MDDPTEQIQEDIHHHAAPSSEAHDKHAGHHASWITGAALTAAFLAAFAAVTGSLSTSHLTQSTLKRIEANDKWTYYESKSIKNSLLDLKIFSAQLANVPVRKKDADKFAEYALDMPEIQASAQTLEKLSGEHLETHESYEFAATMFHISIAMVAIAVVAKRRSFWYLSILLGILGIFFFGKAYAHAPIMSHEEKTELPTGPVPGSPPATQGTVAAQATALEQSLKHTPPSPATAPAP